MEIMPTPLRAGFVVSVIGRDGTITTYGGPDVVVTRTADGSIESVTGPEPLKATAATIGRPSFWSRLRRLVPRVRYTAVEGAPGARKRLVQALADLARSGR